MTDLSILDTHYGVVRYLYYEVLLKRKRQINDLQNQILFLKNINKYLLCRTGQFAHLYNLYSDIPRDKIIEYFELNKIKMNQSRYTWIDYTRLILAPEIVPVSIDGPYSMDNISLRTYTYFWSREIYDIRSNILATPFFCLDGIDHLHNEMIKWKSTCEVFDNITMNISVKHIFHDIFYIVDIHNKLLSDIQNVNIRFMVWLDDATLESELYATKCNDNSESCLLKRLYISCDSPSFIYNLSTMNDNHPQLIILNCLVNNLSRNFVSTFDGRCPKIFSSAILDVTNNNSSSSMDSSLDFTNISSTGFNNDVTDQVYTIEKLSELQTAHVTTPNFLLFQETTYSTTAPSIIDMNSKLQLMLNYLSIGVIDNGIFIRMFMMTDKLNTPEALKKQFNIIYTQKYIRFDISRNREPDLNPTFFDKIYVFSAKHLACTVKSPKYLVRDVIKSTPLIPPCAMMMFTIDQNDLKWLRVTQNIFYLKNLRTLFFTKNFTLQLLNGNVNNISMSSEHTNIEDVDMKMFIITNDKLIRDELVSIFTYNDLNKLEIATVVTYRNVDLKKIVFVKDFNMELFYFAKNSLQEHNTIETLQTFIYEFMQSIESRQKIDEKLYTIFLHLHNLFRNNMLL